MKDGLTQVKELKDKIHEQHFEIERLNNIINELEKELDRLKEENEELKHKLKLINSYVYGCDIDSLGVDKE